MASQASYLLLRIFVGEDDRPGDGPACRTILEALRDQGLAGATVLKGIAGYGASSRIHTGSILRLSEDLPLVIECIDEASRIDAALPVILDLAPEALITTERVLVHTPKPDPA